MSIIMQEFDFSKQMISATSKHVTLRPGDKVIWRKSNRRMYGVSFDIRCTVVKVSAKSVKVLCRWRERNTGEIRTEERNVPLRSIYRYDWQEIPADVNERLQATVLEAVRSELQPMAGGSEQPYAPFSNPALRHVTGRMEDEIGYDESVHPYYW